MNEIIVRPTNALTNAEESRKQSRRESAQDRSVPPQNESRNNTQETPKSQTQENLDTSQHQELINDKFAKSLESIGDILKGSVNAQKKAFKDDLDKVEKTYKAFVKTSSEQASILNNSTNEQKDVFKGLTDQFIKFREDETGDAKRFHADLLASLQALYAAGGDEESTKVMDKMIRDAIKSSPFDPNAAAIEKKWKLTDKEKESWTYKLFGYKEPKSEISPEDIAIKSGQAENISKNLFGDGKGNPSEKTPTEKMLESILRNTERNTKTGDAKRGEDSPFPKTIDKLTISNLIVEKIGGKVGEMLERIAEKKRVHGPKPHKPIEEYEPTYDELRKKSQETVDVEFRDIPATPRKSSPKLLGYDATEIDTNIESNVPNSIKTITSEPNKIDSIVPKSEVEPNKQTNPKRKLTTTETPMSKAIRSAMSDYKPSIEQPKTSTLPMIVESGKVMSTDIVPIASSNIVPVTPESTPNEPEGGGLSLTDAASLIPAGALGKAGGALKRAGTAALRSPNLLRGAKGLGLGMVGGIAGDVAADYLGRDTKAGASADVLGNAASMAGTGAMIGSVVPGVGTAIGAGIGGIVGAGYGLYNNWGTLSKPSAKSVNTGADLGKMSNDAQIEKATENVPRTDYH